MDRLSFIIIRSQNEQNKLTEAAVAITNLDSAKPLVL